MTNSNTPRLPSLDLLFLLILFRVFFLGQIPLRAEKVTVEDATEELIAGKSER